VGRGSWVVRRGSCVVGRASCVVRRGSWVVGRESRASPASYVLSPHVIFE